MLIKRVILALFCIGINALTCGLSVQAKTLNKVEIEKLFKRYQSDLHLQGSFKLERFIKELGLSLNSNGVFELSKGSADQLFIDWQIQKPERLHVCIEKDQVYYIIPGQNKVDKKNLKAISQNDLGVMTDLFSLMDFNPQTIEQKYNLTQEKNILILKNKTSQSLDEKTQITISTDGLVKTVKLYEANQDYTQIEFEKIKALKSMQKNQNQDCLLRLQKSLGK